MTIWTAVNQASLSITSSQNLIKLMSVESLMPSNYLILYRPLLLLPSIFPNIRAFASESVPRIRWPKYWNFSISISPSKEYSELISFKIDWFDLLAGPITNSQGSLKLMSIESVMLFNHLILCRFLLLLRSIFPSIRQGCLSQTRAGFLA